MVSNGRVALVTGAGSGIGKAVEPGLAGGGIFGGSGRDAARRNWKRPRRRRYRTAERCSGGAHRREQAGIGQGAVRARGRSCSDGWTCCSTTPASAGAAIPHGRSDARAVERGGRREPDRGVPVRAGSDQNDEGAAAARRTHHQQRLDLGPRAAPEFRALHGHEARHDRADEMHLARRPEIRHRLQPDRYRQRRHGDDRTHVRPALSRRMATT